jgi:hypothetical protein
LDLLCDYGSYFDATASGALGCTLCPPPEQSHPFNEREWRCGERKPQVEENTSSGFVILLWVGGILLAGALLSVLYYQYSLWMTNRPQTDWREQAARDLRRGLRLDVLVLSAILSDVCCLLFAVCCLMSAVSRLLSAICYLSSSSSPS